MIRLRKKIVPFFKKKKRNERRLFKPRAGQVDF